MPKISKLNLVFAAEVILFFMIIFGIVPRWFAFGLAGMLIIYSLLAPLEDAVVLFVRLIPLFIALPITASFDNFNTWRVIALIIFIKFSIFNFRSVLNFQFSKIKILLLFLLLISILSIFVATDKTAAILRVIYFVNLSLVAIVIYHLAVQHLSYQRRLIINFIPPLVIVLAVGFFQLASTYFMDIYQFIGFWGIGVQCRQFGIEWCRIAVEQGNTWFAYNAFGQINLRMFSLFTDSHTFPMFILMALPAVFAYAAEKLDFTSLKTAMRSRARLWILLVPLGFLAAVLSNTRGIWLAGWGITLVAFILAAFWKKVIFRYLTTWLIAYLLMFAFVYPISATLQFHLYAGRATLTARVRSILDFAETSNALRIAIWKSSLRSIAAHPLLGVGIGNFPVVLQQDIELAKAGSSAHNLYLQIAAELGIPALIAALWSLWLVLKKTYALRSTLYGSSLLIFFPWILLYLMTDAALFDERAFLMFSAVCATILGYGTTTRLDQSRRP